MSEPIRYRPLSSVRAVTVLCALALTYLGYVFGTQFYERYVAEPVVLAAATLGLVVLVALGGVMLGRYAKNAVEYHSPEWEYTTVDMTTDEVAALARSYPRQYVRLVPNGHMVAFYAPLLLTLFAVGVVAYASTVDTLVGQYIPIVFAVVLPLQLALSVLLGFLATSNAASPDFTLPLLREALWLARQQQRVPGVERVYIAIDRAQVDGLSVYRKPKVIAEVKGLHGSARVESISDEKGAVRQVIARLAGDDTHPDVTWWWTSWERVFTKRVGGDKDGEYYVRNPVPSEYEELGVKDVRLLTMNAVALTLQEALQRGERDDLQEALHALGAAPIPVRPVAATEGDNTTGTE